MKPIDILQPVSAENPCGPDLEQENDPAFLDYYYEAESRLPERYFIPGSTGDGREDRLFDPRSIDLRAEERQIMALLARSRDLRLVSLLARFQILAGRLAEFVNSVDVMTGMLTQWPDAVHPRIDAGHTERRGAIEALNSQTVVVMPLTHLPLLADADISLRRYLVAAGKVPPRMSEEGLPGADVTEALRNPGNLSATGRVQALLTQLAEALHQLQRLAGVRTDLGAVRGVVADIQDMIAASRPELSPWSEDQAATAPLPPAEDAAVEDAPATVPTLTRGHAFPDRNAAAAGLDAAQVWLARFEPSSPVLLLVAQARALVGVPLVEALDALMPDRVGAAVLKIGQGSGFSLPMDRMRHLTRTGLEGVTSEPPVTAAPPIANRTELLAVLTGVENYFNNNEPASPIPLLLARGRGMLDKRFDAILAELLSPAVDAG